MPFRFGRGICCVEESAEALEWLVTNGSGGYASGTVAGILTRRYHGLLVAALDPPVGRYLLVAKLDEIAEYGGASVALSSNRWADGAVDPRGYIHIESFYLDGGIPVWNYAIADAILEKRVWMEQGADTTYIRYKLLRASKPLVLGIKVFVNYRDYHGSTSAGGWKMDVGPVEGGISVKAYEGAAPYYVLADKADVEIYNQWYYGFGLSLEKYRGLGSSEDHLLAAEMSRTLTEGESLTVVASTAAPEEIDGAGSLAGRKAYEETILQKFRRKASIGPGADSALVERLALSADQFIVARPGRAEKPGSTVIAGYHWFGDWGRDTMVSLPGLTLTTGRPEVARDILETFAGFISEGMLPNRFPDAGQAPEYNTVDAALWYFEAVRAYFGDTRDEEFITAIFPALEGIIDSYTRGTRYGIKADPNDGLLYAGEEGVQLTWMDARVGGRVITPRMGKPVEVNALWYSALRSMSEFAHIIGKPTAKFDSAADLALTGFERFWNEDRGYCFDVVDGPQGNDPALRPNQIFAVSLSASPLDAERRKKVVDACAEKLLTSHGLRSLSPESPGYKGVYGGDQSSRDGAYHQGTVWGWLIGPFALAHMKVYGDAGKAKGFLRPMLDHMRAAGVGTMSEIFDGDPPMKPRGCIAQAWTVGEILRALAEIDKSSRGKNR
ncbi:MAG TPA: amylo-alpha-1,6-glucosidase [Thermodesulfobacteriota bacterium]|mgnify:CR=1 FL=1|nr:amylo-alpha-1,6-glucosidase [Thermodesulfobacteriota bacterium]